MYTHTPPKLNIQIHSMTFYDKSSIGYSLDVKDIFTDSARSRSILQNNEDKIEEFNKWSENMVRFVKTILEEASRMAQMLPNLETQINKFSTFQDAFGVHKTVEAFDTISNLLKNTQSSNFKLVTNISERLLIPLQKYFQEDFKGIKDSRKSFDKTSERYDGVLTRYYGLSKFKDVSDLDEDLVQLYDNRIAYFDQYSEHVTKINNFKETIDLLFLEKITILIDDLSDFFNNLSENFHSVKLQLDKGRGEFEKLNRKSEENRVKNQNYRSEVVQEIREKWDPNATIVRKLSSEKGGNLLMKRKKTTLGTPWRRVYAIISSGHFSYEFPGKIRGTLESHENLNVMMCEIRPIDLNDRRFCFEIYTGQQSHVYQAESEDDMMDWINTFHTAKSEMLQKRKSPAIEMASLNEKLSESAEISVSTLNKSFNYSGQIILKKWNEELHKQFSNLSESEVTLCSFPASLHTDIWTQGRVFVSQFAVYFYSSLFGIGTKIIIPLKEIINIDVVETSFVTLLNFTLAGDSKDLTLKTFNSVDDSSERFIEHLQLLYRNTQSSEPRDALSLFHEMQINSETTVGEVVDSADIDSTFSEAVVSNTLSNQDTVVSDSLPTKEVSCGCPNHMEKRSINTIIPVDCRLAFDLMFGPKCPVQKAIQVKRKNRNYKITDWKENAEGVLERVESYLFPLNNPLVRAKETECYVTIKLSKNVPGRRYVVDCKTNTPNIPYADSFYTLTRYCITWAGPEQTRVSVCLGIVWIKSPFVKSIIKSATYKTFDETCLDYLACLRQEIAIKIGPSSGTGEMLIQNALDDDKEKDKSLEKDERGIIGTGQESNLLTRLFEIVNQYKIHIFLFLLAYFIGRFGSFRSGPPEHIMSSYDLELEILREFNASKMSLNGNNRVWMDQKLQRSHFQLNGLHEEFALVRKSIWYTLQRINDLERRIYRAQMAALLGDRVLACYDGESPACSALREQWKNLIKEKDQ